MNHAFSANRQASRYNGMPCSRGHLAHRLDVGHRDRLAASRIIGDGDHHQRNALAPSASISRSSASTSMLPLNGIRAWVSAASGNGRSTARAPLNSMLARVVSKCVLFGTTVARFAQDREQNPLGRAALMGGNDVAEAGERPDGLPRNGRNSRCPRKTRRRASWPPTARWTSRWCRSRSAGRSEYRGLGFEKGCNRLRLRIARARLAWSGAAVRRS